MSNATVLKKISESRRDALVNYAIANNSFNTDKIKNADDLYQYLLLDTKISSEVKTSKVAEAMASLQLYIERCVDGAEPDAVTNNVEKHFSTDKFLHNWNLYNSRYSRWAGKEKLKYYAADYIDPTLRYNKTELFTEFEQNINQGKLTESAVTKAIQKYLIGYDNLTHVDTISHVKIDDDKTHFFLGRSQNTPYKYYWRSCTQQPNSTQTYIWTEWKKVNSNINGLKKIFISIAWEKKRLYLNWLTKENRKDNKGEEHIHTTHQTSYKNDDDTWTDINKIEFNDNDINYPINKYQNLSSLFNEYNLSVTEITNPDGSRAKGQFIIKLSGDGQSWEGNVIKPFEMSDDKNNGITIKNIVLFTNDGEKIAFENVKNEKPTVLQSSGIFYIYHSSALNTNSTNFSNEIIKDAPEHLTAPDSLPLVGELQQGIDHLLDYNTQKNYVKLSAFNESYGIYLWELFFHIPLLASARFLTEQRFDEAERWLKFLFNSAGYRNSNGELQQDEGKTRYWNILPLQQDTDLATNDPDVIAMQDPMQYKLAVFMRTLDVLITRGDQSYRQLEPDTLVDAKMYYVQASQLLGPRPDIKLADDKNAQSLKDTAKNINENFLPPYNEVLLTYWNKLEIRLYNLRHNLSLDGQPLHLPLFATPIDPKELQREHGAGNGINSPLSRIAAATSLYRFPLLLDRAKSAVSTVMQFGNTLQIALEKQDNEALTLLLQQQQQQVLKQTRDIQNANIDILHSSRKATKAIKDGTTERLNHYKKLLAKGNSANEDKATDLRISATVMNTGALEPLMIGGAMDLAPNVFGMADGGSRWGALAQAGAWALQIGSSTLAQTAGVLDVKASYARRTEEWQLQHTLAEKELAQLQEQLKGLDIQISMAEKQRDLIETEQSHALAIYQMQTTRFSGKELYNWMVGRLSGLYYQLFDAAQPLCLMAKSALARDIDANKTQHLFISSGWSDLYQGLLAGEDLMLNLQKLENVWLIEDQRALEVERTVSLAKVYKDIANVNLAEKVAEYINGKNTDQQTADNGTAVSIKDNILSASIKINELALDQDYPQAMSLGNKRRIKQISVSLPALLGPYQDVQATLSYDGTHTGLAKGCTAMAISRGMNDSGLFQLDFNDSKYLPFEGIDINDDGALVLRFPNATSKQQALLQSLSDIILHVRYTIRS